MVIGDKGTASSSAQGAKADTVKIESSDEEVELNAWDLITMPQPSQLPSETPMESEHEINDACTETSSSDISEGEGVEPVFESKGVRTFSPPVAPEGYTMWQHTKSKILHLEYFKTPNVFECGRKPGPLHTSSGVSPRWDTGICWKCFKNK